MQFNIAFCLPLVQLKVAFCLPLMQFNVAFCLPLMQFNVAFCLLLMQVSVVFCLLFMPIQRCVLSPPYGNQRWILSPLDSIQHNILQVPVITKRGTRQEAGELAVNSLGHWKPVQGLRKSGNIWQQILLQMPLMATSRTNISLSLIRKTVKTITSLNSCKMTGIATP